MVLKKGLLLGVVTKLDIQTVNFLIQDTHISFEKLKETTCGITDSTYIGFCSNQTPYVFKVFEHSNIEDISEEITLLQQLYSLKVPQVLSQKIVSFKNKPTLLFSYIKGENPLYINEKAVEQITLFLHDLHQVNTYVPKRKNIYTLAYLLNKISSIEEKSIQELFLSRLAQIKKINLEANAIIHGDLFPDNAKFIDGKLSGVYDFAQSCYGNRYFDLAVMMVSWCFKEDKYDIELHQKVVQTYFQKEQKVQMKAYLLFASLYYAVQRYTRVHGKKDYNELIQKFDILHKKL